MFTFFPSVFIFSITLLRDPLIILCILTILYGLTKLNKAMDYKSMTLLLITLIPILFLREQLFAIMTLLTILVLLINKKVKHKLGIISLMVTFAILATNTGVFCKINFRPMILIKNAAPVIFAKNANLYITGGRLAYRVFPKKHHDAYWDSYRKHSNKEDYFKSDEKITTVEFIKCLPRGILFYFLRPIPFAKKNFIDNLISVQMLYWYMILILAMVGIFKTRFTHIYPLILYITIMIAVTSMVDANEGILLRHRDSVVPFFILFASNAIDKFKRAISLKLHIRNV